LITVERPIGQPGICEEHGNFQVAGAPEEIGPDLGFHQHNGFRVDDGESAPDPFTAVDGVIDLADVGGQAAFQFGHAGRGGGGHDHLDVRQAQFERANELGAQVDFADADSVEPDDLAIGQRLFQVGAVIGKAFIEARTPVAAPPHAPKIIRRGQDKKDRKQDVVKCAHSG
jgi:hypothetical protein